MSDKDELLVCGKRTVAFSYSEECHICKNLQRVWLVMEDYGFGGDGVVAIHSSLQSAEKDCGVRQEMMKSFRVEEWNVCS